MFDPLCFSLFRQRKDDSYLNPLFINSNAALPGHNSSCPNEFRGTSEVFNFVCKSSLSGLIYNKPVRIWPFDFASCLLQGDNGLGATKMVHMLTEGPPKVAIIGPTVSDGVIITGQISPVFHTVQVNLTIIFHICDNSLHYKNSPQN